MESTLLPIDRMKALKNGLRKAIDALGKAKSKAEADSLYAQANTITEKIDTLQLQMWN